jgi:L-ascorbate metabolism protein UlaG (beta-lactamase superfamily)
MPHGFLRAQTIFATLAALLLMASLAAAQTSSRNDAQTSICQAIAENHFGPRLSLAGFEPAAVADDEVTITYVGHSAFRIVSPEGVNIVTDYAGFFGEGPVPDVVTMNHAHSSHYTDNPDPAIAHVLRGWNPGGDGPARHHLQVGDVYIRNVTTDLYSNGVMIEKDGNSIFIFEMAGLCVGHLGHLHHKLTPQHIAEIGRIDILFVPVDGTFTMSLAGMIELAGQLRSSMVIPMHFFSTFTLQRFVAGMAEKFNVETANSDTVTVSLKTLPEAPTVMVLSPY